jgi:hypothetical protein
MCLTAILASVIACCAAISIALESFLACIIALVVGACLAVTDCARCLCCCGPRSTMGPVVVAV